jgi:hypothetical protein
MDVQQSQMVALWLLARPQENIAAQQSQRADVTVEYGCANQIDCDGH